EETVVVDGLLEELVPRLVIEGHGAVHGLDDVGRPDCDVGVWRVVAGEGRPGKLRPRLGLRRALKAPDRQIVGDANGIVWRDLGVAGPNVPLLDRLTDLREKPYGRVRHRPGRV